MDLHSDSDSSCESESDSDQESIIESNEEEVDQPNGVEPELSAPIHTEYETFSTPMDQLKARLHEARLAQLHIEIKARASIPKDPTY
jgi:hypothetical protein